MPPAAFSARHFATLESAAGERGGQSIIRSLPAEAIVMVPETVLADADTPEQLNALAARSPKE